MFASFVRCDAGDWIGIAVIAGIGVFSLIFLGFGIAVLAKYLFWSDRNKRLDTP